MSENLPAVIGVGNILMGDDGVGPKVIDLLKARGLDSRAELLDAGLALSEVLCDLEPETPLVIVDAVRGGNPPGTIYRMNPSDIDVQTGSMAISNSVRSG